jgi:hypothetical protein
MSKQDKIEKAQKAKASQPEVKSEVKTGTDPRITFTSSPIGEQFWKIAGTSYAHRSKEELKKVRRALNMTAGINECEVDVIENKIVIEKIPAVPSNKWPFRISKGPNHPSLKA